jgi:energy-coupling factor transport system ATP-binding protein
MINITNLSFAYNEEQQIFKNLNLSIQENNYISIIGDNGSGKSTLAKLITGIIIPDKGNIKIDDFNTNDSKNIFEIRKRVSLIMPNPEWQLIGSIVEEEISSGLYNLNCDEKDINHRVSEISEMLDINHLLNKTTEDLSGGEKQIVNLASVLILKPKYLILDEPISMLDKHNQKIVLNFLDKLKSIDITVIFISHSINEVMFTDYIIGLKNGIIMHDKISTLDFINKNIYKEYNFNMNFEYTLKRYLNHAI